MSKQTVDLRKMCQSRAQCLREAEWAVYIWKPGETDVNLNSPFRVYCGRHKPKMDPNKTMRLVRIAT